MKDKILGEGITFDDVLLAPAYSRVDPAAVDTSTQLTRNIRLNIPLVSAPMDTVTEAALAIALAQAGGIGIIHRNLKGKAQAREVEKVKRSENGIIVDPITLTPDESTATARDLMAEHNVSGFPIITAEGKLAGILTRRDMKFLSTDCRIDKVMTATNLVTAPPDTSLEQAHEILNGAKVEKLLLTDGEGRLAGMITMRDIDKLWQFPRSCKDSRGRLRVGAAVGVLDFERVELLIDRDVDVIVVDTSHGHKEIVLETVRQIKAAHNIDVIAGNIATAAAAEDLIAAGADGLRVGITKALAAGASAVMLGSLFAGLDESPGELVIYKGRRFKTYRGMGSMDAMLAGSADRYHQGDVSDPSKLVPEGVEGRVPYRGTLADFVHQLIGGLRSGMDHCGTETVELLRTTTKFVRISGASLAENHPHDIAITHEPPNYSVGLRAEE